MKTNNFPILHLSPASSVDNNYTIENPANVDSEAQINSRVRRTVPSLREICLSKLHPEKIPQFGDACFANFLNNANRYNQRNQPIGIVQTEIDQLSPEWISSITGNQMALLNATFFNALSKEQIWALTPEQLTWIRPEEFQKLSSIFINNLNTDQIQAITRDQIHNISIASWEGISREQLERFRCEQISWIHPNLFKEFDMEFFDNLIFGPQGPVNAIIPLITGITREQMQNIPSSFFNSASDQLIQGFTPEQISWIHPNAFKELNANAFYSNISRWQCQAITREQLCNIPPDRYGMICYYLFAQSNLGYFALEQYEWFTDAQINAIFNFYSYSVKPDFRYHLRFLVSRLLYRLGQNQDQVAALPEEILPHLDRDILRNSGARFSHFLLASHRQRLTADQLQIVEENATCWQRIEGWTPEAIAQMSPQQLVQRLSELPPRSVAALSREQFAAISSQVLNSLGEDFWRNIMSDITHIERRYFMSFWTREQVASTSDDVLSILPLCLLSPEAIPGVPPEVLARFLEMQQNNHEEWTAARIAALTPTQIALLPTRMFRIVGSSLYVLNRIFRPEVFNAFLMRPAAQVDQGFWGRWASALSRERIESILPSTLQRMEDSSFFSSLTAYQLHWMSPEQIAALPDFIFVSRKAPGSLFNLGKFYVNLASFTSFQIPHLNSEVFRVMQEFQISKLNGIQIRSLTIEQIRKIPPEVFEAMSARELARIYRSFTEEQRNSLTPEQRAIFRRIMGEVTGEINTSNSDRPPPPSGGGSGGGEGRKPGSSGGASGGARPKDSNLVAKQYGVSSESSNKKEHAPFLSLEYIRKAPAEFWNKYAGPKMQIRTASYTSQGLPIVEVKPINLEEYQEWIRALSRDQVRSIPPAVISQLDWFVLEAFSAKQIFWMTLEQRKACTTGFIKIEPELRELLGISKNQMLTINGKQISSSQSLVPEDFEALMDQLDGKQLQQRCSPEKIRNLAKNPRSFLLPFLKPKHIISVDSHDLLPSQIEALGKEIITEIWGPTYFNKLVPDQRKGILPYISEIDPAVIAKWEPQCFDSPGENPVIHDNYRDQIRKFTQEQIASIAPEVIAVLGVRFFRDYLSPQQVRMLRKEQIQAISARTLSQLPADWFYYLIEEKEGGKWDTQWVNSLRENQVKSIPLPFFSKFGGKVGKRVALQLFEGLWEAQVQAITKEQLDALSAEDFSLLPVNFLNKLSNSQIKTRTPAQIAALGVLFISALQEDFIAALTTDQIKEWAPQQVSALKENQIRALGNKIISLPSDVYLDNQIINKFLLSGTIEQLNLINKDKAQKADLSKISVKDFEQASAQNGQVFINFFKEALIAHQNLEYRKAISNRLYAQFINDIHKKLTDEDCKKLAVNMSVMEYRMGLKVFIDALRNSKGILTDEEKQAIFSGTYRIRISKNISNKIIFSALGQNEKSYAIETQIPTPPIGSRLPDNQVVNNMQAPLLQRDNDSGLALLGAHTRTNL